MSKTTIFVILGLLLGLIGMGYWQSVTQDNLDKAQQNYIAAHDSVKVLQLKNHELLYEKEIYILKESELSERLKITQNEIKEIKKKLNSSIDYISKIEGLVKIDTIYTTDTIYYDKDSIPSLKFDYNDLYLSLSGITKFENKIPQTTIHNILVPLSLQTGLTDDYKIFVKTDNPYVNIIGLDGAVVDEKRFKTNFHHELQIGIGFQYGLFNKNIDFGPQIGYGFIIEF